MTYVAKLALENWRHFLLMNIGQYSLKQLVCFYIYFKWADIAFDWVNRSHSTRLFCFHVFFRIDRIHNLYLFEAFICSFNSRVSS